MFSYRDYHNKKESFMEITFLIFSLLIYYKTKYGFTFAITIHNLLFEITITNWKNSPINKLIDKLNARGESAK